MTLGEAKEKYPVLVSKANCRASSDKALHSGNIYDNWKQKILGAVVGHCYFCLENL